MEERSIDCDIPLPAGDKSEVVTKPRKSPLDFPALLYLRRGLPSCIGALRRPLRCGQINSIPRRARRFRNGSLL